MIILIITRPGPRDLRMINLSRCHRKRVIIWNYITTQRRKISK